MHIYIYTVVRLDFTVQRYNDIHTYVPMYSTYIYYIYDIRIYVCIMLDVGRVVRSYRSYHVYNSRSHIAKSALNLDSWQARKNKK